jgi:hypothetical protein
MVTDIVGPAAAPPGAGRRGAPGGPPTGFGSIFTLSPPFTGEGPVVDPLTLQTLSLSGPSIPPTVPLTAAAPLYVNGVTAPRGMAMIDGHLWVSDRFTGLCRVDVLAGIATLSNVCAANTTGLAIPGQPVVTFQTDPVTGAKTVWHVFVPDLAAAGSQGVLRFDYDAVNQALINPITAVPGTNRPSSLAMGSDGNVYISFFNLNSVTRILTPDANPTLDKPIGTTLDGGGVKAIAFVNNDLYLAENSGTTLIPLATSRTKSIQAIRFGDVPGVTVKGFVSRLTQAGAIALASDGTDKLYLGVPVDVQAFSVSKTQQYDFSNRGFDGTNEDSFVSVSSLLWDPTSSTLYVGEDAFGLNLPQHGHIWAVPSPWNHTLVPSYLQAITITDGSVQLKWHDWSTLELGFKIQRQEVPADGSAPAAFADIADVPSQTFGSAVGNDFWTDTNVTPGTTYNYQIASYGVNGDQSPWTVPGATASVLALPPAATDLAATSVTPIRVDLAWTDNSLSETGFRVERANDSRFSTGLVVIGDTPANATGISDTSVIGGNTYFYRVIVHNATADGASSNVVSVAVPLNHPPVVTNPGNQITVANNTVSLQIIASDVDNNFLTFSATGLPTGLVIDSGSGLITGTAATPGAYNVQVIVTDGFAPTTINFTWSVATTPVAVSVTPSSGQGLSQTFTFTYSDAVAGNFLKTVWANIGTSSAYPNSCAMMYDVLGKKFYVVKDDASGWLGPITPGTTATVGNSQCSVSGTGLTASVSGTQLALNVPVTFANTYVALKNIYTRALNQASLDSGWQLKGTWTPFLSTQPPSVVSVTPSSGSGTSQTFQLAFSNSNGYQNLKTLWAQISTSTAYPLSCATMYDAVGNKLYLIKDDATGWLGGVTPGTATTIQNSQCTLNVGSSSAVGSGNNFTLTLALNFASSYIGTKNIYGRGLNASSIDSGWVLKGTWTTAVPQPVPPTVNSLAPNAGTGLSQAFALSISDVNGYKDLANIFLQVNTSTAYPNGCAVRYDAVANRLYLVNDAGSAWLGPITPGTATTLANTQCQVNGSSSGAVGAGTGLTLNVSLTFLNYSGAKNVYGRATNAGAFDSGWQVMGTWTPQ